MSAARMPPLLLGAALMLWGWRTELLAFALPMVLLIEVARLVPWRWDFSDREFNRIADVSTLAFVLLVAWQFDEHGLGGIYAVLRWLPVVFVLLLAAQLYSTRDAVRYSALFLSVRVAEARGNVGGARALDVRAAFFALALIAATAGARRDAGLFVGCAVLIGWWLFANRPRRYHAATWLGVLALAVAGGYAGQRGIIEVRRAVEPLVMAWIREYVWDMRDPYRSQTAIGEIGELKVSNRIVLWVHVPGGQPVPDLLREAAYRTFSNNVWMAAGPALRPLPPSQEDGVWSLAAAAPDAGLHRVWVSRRMRRGRGLLAVPRGAVRIDHLPVAGVAGNPLGALEVSEGPDLVRYRVHYRSGTRRESPPDRQRDLGLPTRERAVVERVAAALGLRQLAPAEAVARVRRFFAGGFSYSLGVRRPRPDVPSLEDFLTHSRRGHCEYFATATALLLRAAGVPARYQTGFALREYNRLEGAWVARRRHSHAWTLAWVDGAWLDVDTTPSTWAAEEARATPWWQPVTDLFSWIAYRFRRWRLAPDEDSSGWYFWVAGALAGFLGFRLYRSERIARGRRATTTAGTRVGDGGADSAFDPVERWLAERGLVRPRGEALGRWLARLDAEGALGDARQLRGELLPAHYRERFHPQGLERAARVRLLDGVQRWLRAERTRSAADRTAASQ